MDSREKIIRTLKREKHNKVPFYFEFCPSLRKVFEEKTGAKAEDYQYYFKFDIVSADGDLFGSPLTFLESSGDFGRYYKNTDMTNVTVNEWGLGIRTGTFEHFWRLIHPLENVDTVDGLLEYPFPEISQNQKIYDDYAAKVKELHSKGLVVLATGNSIGGAVFWPAYKLRGMEKILIDMYDNEQYLEVLLDKVVEVTIEHSLKKVQYGIDIILLADDYGTQNDLLVSPLLWEKWFKERLRKVIKSIKAANPDILVAFHSDGAIEKIIPHLIDIGVDILNPVQPECMDFDKIFKAYGDRLSFWGTVGTQTTMPFGSPDEVEEVVKRNIEIAGNYGGLLMGPTHLLEPEVPWDNIIALVDAMEKYGRLGT